MVTAPFALWDKLGYTRTVWEVRMPNKLRPIADLRAFQRREDRRLILVVMLFLVIVGGATIGLVYGWGTALTGAVCLAVGAGVLGLLWLILVVVERWAGRE